MTYRIQYKKTTDEVWKDIGKSYFDINQAKDCFEWLQNTRELTNNEYTYRMVKVVELIEPLET
jgi:hypothetical protein